MKSIYIFLLRISFGILFFYSGITKILNPDWSAAGYLKGAVTFPFFYNLLSQPSLLPITNFINEWGMLLLGISLLLGVGVRISTIFGAILMFLYYIPVLSFPYVGQQHSFLVDEHIIYIFSLLLLGSLNAGRYWGLDKRLIK